MAHPRIHAGSRTASGSATSCPSRITTTTLPSHSSTSPTIRGAAGWGRESTTRLRTTATSTTTTANGSTELDPPLISTLDSAAGAWRRLHDLHERRLPQANAQLPAQSVGPLEHRRHFRERVPAQVDRTGKMGSHFAHPS